MERRLKFRPNSSWIKLIAAGLMALALAALMAAKAAADITYHDDNGLYTGQTMDLFTWQGGAHTFNDLFNDGTAPEGSKSILNTGSAWSGFGFFYQVPQNLPAFSGGSLRFWIKGDAAQTVKIEIQNGDNSKALYNLNITTSWVEYDIPFADFSNNAVNFSSVYAPFLFTDNNSGTIYLDDIRWISPAADSIDIYPSQTQVNPGGKRQFVIEGGASPSLSVTPANLGTLSANSGTEVVFTANGTLQTGQLIVESEGEFYSADITVTDSNLDQVFGVLSETHPGLLIDTDSTFGTYSGGGGTILTSDETVDFQEGTLSVQTDLNVPGGGWAGWAIEWTSTADKDMNEFYDGSIRFWFKGPPALETLLKVGIRSSNVGAGAENSITLLSNYTTFDNSWHSVVVPLADLAGEAPDADLSRTAVFINFAVTENSGGSQTFYVDNIRWDTTAPGPLDNIAVTPADVTIPTDATRQFVAQGFDSNNVEVDIDPVWTKQSGLSNSTFLDSDGPVAILKAPSTDESGVIQAQFGGITGTANVTVQDITITQSFNVYSDLGSGGFVGTTKNTNSSFSIAEVAGGDASDPETFRRASFTLDNQTAANDAFALWFTSEPDPNSRYMGPYSSDGYIQFYVRSTHDIQVGVRSANITPGAENSKIRLSQLGVPLDGTWQKVVLSLQQMKTLEPSLDFNQMKVFFVAAVESSWLGEISGTFDIDNVKWITSSGDAVDTDKVYQGLKDKIGSQGLLSSFNGLGQAVTYDNALAAMVFTYNGDTAEAKGILDVYKAKFEGSWDGFHDEYNVDTLAVVDTDRVIGPNAWVMLAALHYKAKTLTTDYDAMINGLASWIAAFQAADNAIQFGIPTDGTPAGTKSTEHNFDVYAAFMAYDDLMVKPSFRTIADGVLNWLETEAYIPNETRFAVGEEAGGAQNDDKALDAYAWAALALSSYSATLTQAEVDMSTSYPSDLTGRLVEGFDFGGPQNAEPDLDAVWLEGTAHMVAAFAAVGNDAKAQFYKNELDKAVVSLSPTSQGLAYATNNGTAYGGWLMNSLDPSLSAMTWYMMANQGFNPFRPLGQLDIRLRSFSGGEDHFEIAFTADALNGWVKADHYFEVFAGPSTDDNWGLQIYSDNTDPLAYPQFVDYSPGDTTNLDSDPAGLIMEISGQATSHYKIPVAWNVSDTLGAIPAAADPNNCPGVAAACNWIFLRDKATPALDLDGDGNTDTTAFVDGEDDARVIRTPSAPFATGDIHAAQGDNFFPAPGPNYITLEADFSRAAAQRTYQAVIYLELFTE